MHFKVTKYSNMSALPDSCSSGLTLREYFVAQLLASNEHWLTNQGRLNEYVQRAIETADEALRQLGVDNPYET